ncbi:family 43 glycosylhydrolase [Kribbella albertanoniae]|nr:family 43 glycosylhydrolase [Kribbella albertanoniae]
MRSPTTWNSTITMRRSRTLAGIATAPDTVVYNLSGHPTPCCNMWAPELHLLGTFYNGSQPNFIRPLSNPWTASGTRRILSTPTHNWETVGGAVNEGAVVLKRNGRTFVVFSASHCSTPEYKLGLLTYNGGDPLNSSSWVKKSTPIFSRNDAAGVYGPGHGNFFKSPDGTEDWMTHHANPTAGGGCDINRSTRAQKFTWNADGTPNLGRPVPAGTALPAPSGEPTS